MLIWVLSAAALANRFASCTPRCHVHAVCVSDNNCTCNPGFVGDGVTRCVRPLPEITEWNPKEIELPVVEETHVSFRIKLPKDLSNPPGIFCRFGPTVVRGIIMNETYVICHSPEMRIGQQLCSLSFDSEEWSAPVTINFIGETLPFGTICGFLAVIMITCAAVVIHWSRTKKSEHVDEVMPLNRWYMHQMHQDVGDESTVGEFIINVVATG